MKTLNNWLEDQIVHLPSGNEELRCVFEPHAATTPGLPEDATLEGWIYWREYIHYSGPLEKRPYFYSESWRTWYPLPQDSPDDDIEPSPVGELKFGS